MCQGYTVNGSIVSVSFFNSLLYSYLPPHLYLCPLNNDSEVQNTELDNRLGLKRAKTPSKSLTFLAG